MHGLESRRGRQARPARRGQAKAYGRIIGETIMKFIITLFQDEDGVFIAECPSIPGCVSQGKTESEAEANIREAIKECLEVRAEKGMPLTVSTRQVEVAV
jgi:predicted RNase H-like HicB family nuclease